MRESGPVWRLIGICLLAVVCSVSPLLGSELRGTILDEAEGTPLPARIYIQGKDGAWHFVQPASADGSAVPYEKRNWLNHDSVEAHTTVSAHGFVVDLEPGDYTVTVERGKEYFPLTRLVRTERAPVSLEFRLRRWIDMAAAGWFSGETHLHRTVEELRNVAIAEDLNVSFPLTHWVTTAFTPPASGDRNMDGQELEGLIRISSTCVIWPRNTEYEIFTIGDKQHTLGALFLLNQRSVLDAGVPPWGPVARRAREEGALLDMDKLDWAFSVSLPPNTGAQLYELANNHMWRTEFAFRQWVSPAAAYLQPPYGGQSGSEREWTLYTLGMYYSLLNCGFRIQPTAGTANGVHPVPAGFGRVYVHLPAGFSYEEWLAGLKGGRSFVTTGPMLFAQVNDQQAGTVFRNQTGSLKARLDGSVRSEQPLAFIEVIQNGIPVLHFMPQNRKTAEGAYESRFAEEIVFQESGWMAVRCWEDRPDGRFRFAHTAPWHVEIKDRPLLPRAEEREFFVGRMKAEMDRSRSVLPPDAYAEYEGALEFYENLRVREEAPCLAGGGRLPADEKDLRYWLQNMVWHHRYSVDEIRVATGLESEAIVSALRRLNISDATRPPELSKPKLRVLPYPGGRHPRIGFLEGAINPQRDTKISVFSPWDPTAYVVVDVPEAILSNLGMMYLAHTHNPTIWGDLQLPRQEWNRSEDGSLDFERSLPNGVRFGTRVFLHDQSVRMELWLHNGTDQPLTNLRVQNCVMLKGAAGFNAQTTRNKVLGETYAAVQSEDGNRWIITAWTPGFRVWANPAVPCLHSDPRFPDCPPGEIRRLRGWLSFFEGRDLQSELERIESTGWREHE
jgi:hypothetical protein